MKSFLFVMFLLLAFTEAVSAQVAISVTKEASSKIALGVDDIEAEPALNSLGSEMGKMLKNNLQVSGYFSVISFARGSSNASLSFWNSQGAEVLVRCRLTGANQGFRLSCEAVSTEKAEIVFRKSYKGNEARARSLIHQVSDDIVKDLTGKAGLGSSRIAFVSNKSGKKQIYVVDWDGRNLMQLTNGKNISIYPKWSPLEEKILCTDYSRNLPHIFLLDLVKKTKKPLSARPGLNAFARLSPDGKKMVLTLSRDGNPEIYTCLADGSRLKRLTRTRAVESSPCWTPDGKKIVFVSDRSGTPQIYWMNADGSNQKRLTCRGGYNTSPEVSPDGKLIAYCSSVRGRFQLFVLDPETKESVQITRGRHSSEDPTWGPSNRHLAYTSTQNYRSDIYIIDIYEGHPLRLTKNMGDCTSPSWSQSF